MSVVDSSPDQPEFEGLQVIPLATGGQIEIGILARSNEPLIYLSLTQEHVAVSGFLTETEKDAFKQVLDVAYLAAERSSKQHDA